LAAFSDFAHANCLRFNSFGPVAYVAVYFGGDHGRL